MSVEHLEVLVEEPSAEAALAELLPKMLGKITFSIHPHQGKTHLLRDLPSRLRGYRSWLPDSWRILVVVDRDEDDCRELENQLDSMAQEAGFATRLASGAQHVTVINRLAIEELEAWFFGDWNAVRAAFPRVPSSTPKRARYRAPDDIRGGTWEALERELQKAGYFFGGLRKIEAARSIAPHMLPERNLSPSFRALRMALMGLLGEA